MNNKLIRVLIVDNNDSFTFNVVDILRKLSYISFEVIPHNDVSIKVLKQYDKFIISPGPGKPKDFGIIKSVIQYCEENNKSLLGICLGHQAICEYYGGKLIQLDKVVHGWQMPITIDNNALLYRGLSNKIDVGLYHSWVIDSGNLPEKLIITGETNSGLLMSVQHKECDIHGIQFHPESFLTTKGVKILANFFTESYRKI